MSERSILVVDDEVEIGDLLRDALAQRGWSVDVALDARRALELVHERLYDAAILDFALPDMNGIMLHRQIRALDAELGARTLFTSGRGQTDDNLAYFGNSGLGFLAKPFDVTEVVGALERLWGG